MAAIIGSIVTWTGKVEQPTVSIVRIDAEGETTLPIDWTIEVLTSHISVILIGGEHKAQILITTLPVEAKDIIAHS